MKNKFGVWIMTKHNGMYHFTSDEIAWFHIREEY